jgi:uncharacterized protein (DUF433 family)
MAVMMAFTTKDAERLTGLSARVLRYWENTGVFAPSYIEPELHKPFRRVYDFRDIVSLRTLALLRRTYGLQLDELRRAGAYLLKYSAFPWVDLRLGVIGVHLAFFDPEAHRWLSANPLGQMVLIDIERISKSAERDALALVKRDATTIGKIERNRYVLGNAWVVAGTRIPTAVIRRLSDAGYSEQAIIEKYPRLTHRDILAARAHEESENRRVA